MKKIFWALAGAALLAGCNPDNPDPIPPATTGVYVLSEGQFGKGDGVVSAFDKSTKALTVDAFGAANGGAALGDVVQDMGVVGNKGIICLNGSNKIEIVSLLSFKEVAALRGVQQPRFFTSNSATRGYVTAWRGNYLTGYTAGKVLVLDLDRNAIVDSIAVGTNPERPTILNNLLYVPNSYDSTISVIDLSTNKVTGTVTVAEGPNTVVSDNQNRLWALCVRPYGSTGTVPGALVRFAPASTTAALTLPLASDYASGLRTDLSHQALYYSYNGAEYRMDIGATTLPTTPFIKRDFNGFALDPRDNSIFAAVLTGYTSNGRFLRYTSTGALIDSFDVRVGPNGFAFY